jgi:hypothetical protein
MGKFNETILPEGTEIIAETDMNPVIAAINAADDVPDQAIQRGVCLAMCVKWVESGVRNLDFWDTLTQDETLNDIKWLQRRETAVRQQMARVLGFPAPPSGEYKIEGLTAAIKKVYDLKKSTEASTEDKNLKASIGEVSKRYEQLLRESKDWFGEAVQERTGLYRETSFNRKDDEVSRVPWDIATGDPGFFVLGIHGNGAHAIAVHAGSDGKVHLMDSDYGELAFPSMIDFVDYFPHHLQEYERSSFGKIQKCTVNAFPVGGMMNRPDEQESQRWRRVFPSELRRHGFLSERPLAITRSRKSTD